MPKTVRDKNRKMRQDQLREQLVAGGHIQHVVDISEKLRKDEDEYKKGEDKKLDSLDIQRLKAAADIKLKLIDKYLPTMKETDLNMGGELTVTIGGVDADTL